MKKPFYHCLDSVRGLAAFLVVIYHFDFLTVFSRSQFIQHGYLMVDVFFALSGFVICLNYSKCINSIKDLQNYFYLRIGRIYPLYLFMLFAFLLIELLKLLLEKRGGPFQSAAFAFNTPKGFVLDSVMLQSFGFESKLMWNGPGWSISAEFYMYALFALITFLFSRFNSVILNIATYAFFAVTAIFLIYLTGPLSGLNFLENLNFDRTFDYGYLRAIYGFSFGAISAFLIEKKSFSEFRFKHLDWAVFCLIFVSVYFDFGFLLAPLASILFYLIIFSGSTLRRILSQRHFVMLGKWSFSLYLIHIFILKIMIFFTQRFHQNKTVYVGGRNLYRILFINDYFGTFLFFIYIFLLILFSRITYERIEVPCRDWVKKK